MSTEDFIVDILLIVVIFRQLWARPYSARTITLIGLALGLASAATTFMWRDETGQVLGRAGVWACVTWVTGMGFRFAFALYATSKAGDRAIGTFSRHHGISGSQAWTTALVLMAFAEVISRVVMLQARRLKLAGAATARPVLTAD